MSLIAREDPQPHIGWQQVTSLQKRWLSKHASWLARIPWLPKVDKTQCHSKPVNKLPTRSTVNSRTMGMPAQLLVSPSPTGCQNRARWCCNNGNQGQGLASSIANSKSSISLSLGVSSEIVVLTYLIAYGTYCRDSSESEGGYALWFGTLSKILQEMRFMVDCCLKMYKSFWSNFKSSFPQVKHLLQVGEKKIHSETHLSKSCSKSL